MFVGIVGTFNFLVKEGAKIFGRVTRGVNNFGRVIWGDFWISNFLEPFAL